MMIITIPPPSGRSGSPIRPAAGDTTTTTTTNNNDNNSNNDDDNDNDRNSKPSGLQRAGGGCELLQGPRREAPPSEIGFDRFNEFNLQ